MKNLSRFDVDNLKNPYFDTSIFEVKSVLPFLNRKILSSGFKSEEIKNTFCDAKKCSKRP